MARRIARAFESASYSDAREKVSILSLLSSLDSSHDPPSEYFDAHRAHKQALHLAWARLRRSDSKVAADNGSAQQEDEGHGDLKCLFQDLILSTAT